MMDHALLPRRFGLPASFLGTAVATLILFGAPACDDTLVPPPGGGTCTVGGLVYPDGATGIPSGDCNSCSCSHGQVACTTIACNTCGGLQGKTCSAALYCNFPQSSQCGAADATGVCAAIPQACTEQLAPVCGCDGKTYGNACLAAAASTSVASEGACSPPPGSCVVGGVTYPDGTNNIPAADGCNTCSCAGGSLLCTLRACPVARACGARAGNTCAANEYCAYVEGEYCGGADAEAVCKARPAACDAINAPVCGCDGQTYSSACNAAQAGTGVLHAGRCA